MQTLVSMLTLQEAQKIFCKNGESYTDDEAQKILDSVYSAVRAFVPFAINLFHTDKPPPEEK